MSQVVSVNSAEHYTWGADCDGWHLLRAPDVSIIEERVPPGASETRHVHARSQQFFYVLRGQATLEIDGQVHVLSARQGIEVPPRTLHQFSNASDADVDFLVISAPPSHGDRVEA